MTSHLLYYDIQDMQRQLIFTINLHSKIIFKRYPSRIESARGAPLCYLLQAYPLSLAKIGGRKARGVLARQYSGEKALIKLRHL